MKYLILIFTCLVSSHVSAAVGPSICDTNINETYVGWPTVDPVWEMCYLSPGQSSASRGSSLEVRNVYFNELLVLERAHVPILFAQYTSGLCYRDWKDDNAEFLRADVVENPTRPAITTCDVSTSATDSNGVGFCPFDLPQGGQAGNPVDCITGVQVEKYSDRMVLTTNHAASWYKYSVRYIFHADGRIQPRFGFGNRNGTQNSTTHWHHAYWRLNFDIDGINDDQVFIADSSGETLQTTEFADFREITSGQPNDPNVFTDEVTWVIKDSVSGRGYRVVAGGGGDSQKGEIDDYAVPADPSGVGFHEVDVMATKYKLNNGVPEYADQPDNSLFDCQLEEENLVGDVNDPGNLPESLVGENLVFWYRTAVNDIAPDGMLCKTGGPTLHPVGDWQLSAAPQANADIETVDENTTDNVIDVLFNDTDVDGGPKFVSQVTQPVNGTVVIGSGGSALLYTPDADYCNDGSPTDDFSYTLNGGSSTTVNITVACIDSLPTASPDVASLNENEVDVVIDVISNDFDPDGGPRFVDSVTQPANGTVIIGAAGANVEYSPLMDYCNDGNPTDDFTYTLNGGSSAAVQVTVNCVAPFDLIFEDDFE